MLGAADEHRVAIEDEDPAALAVEDDDRERLVHDHVRDAEIEPHARVHARQSKRHAS